MKFSLSPLILLATFFTPSFAAPTNTALSKRAGLNFSFGTYIYGPISLRDVETAVDNHRLSKRAGNIRLSLGLQASGGVLKRSTGEADVDLSKRSEEYNLVVTSLSPGGGLSSRSADPYDGQTVDVSIPDNMVEALQQNGVSEGQLPQYISQNVHAKDPDTGNTYELVPGSGATLTATADICLSLIYQPTSA